MMDSWERLIDKDEDKNHEFFVIRENFLKKITSEEPKENIILRADTTPAATSSETVISISIDNQYNDAHAESSLPIVPIEDGGIAS